MAKRPVKHAGVVQRYTRSTVHKDREYGFFWYNWLWKLARPVMVFVCALIIVGGILASIAVKLYDGYIKEVDTGNTVSEEFYIASGESVSQIASNLQEQSFIRSTSVFKYYIQFYGLTNNLQSGVYYISRDMDLFEVADALTSGKGTNERTIRIIPGWTVEDIADYLVSAGALKDKTEFLTECQNYQNYLGYSLALINADENGNMSGRTYPLEGYLAPDTYRVYLNADASSIIKTILKQTDVVYNSLFDHETTYDEYGNILSQPEPNGAKGVVLTDDEIFILASIIEKEAATVEDMERVSAVFYNRLASNMKLQSDPTATYLTGVKRLALTDADTAVNTRYNTYVISGLPVGPICNPSKNALNAALNPDSDYLNQNYLYFCAAEPDSGRLVFAQTSAEHQRNVDKYRPLWEAYDSEHNY